jgi:hypothetical protein
MRLRIQPANGGQEPGVQSTQTALAPAPSWRVLGTHAPPRTLAHRADAPEAQVASGSVRARGPPLA